MKDSPKLLGYHFPAEFEKHDATWLSWPHKEASWPGKIQNIYPAYSFFVKLLAQSEKVNINVTDEVMKAEATGHLILAGADTSNIQFHCNPNRRLLFSFPFC